MQTSQTRSLTTLAVRSAAVAVIARLGAFAVAIILTPIILRGLGKELYGIVATTGSAFDYLVLLRGGLGAAVRRHVTILFHSGAREEAIRYYRAGFWWGLLLRVPMLAAGLLLAVPLCHFVRLSPSLIPDAAAGVTLLALAFLVSDSAVLFDVPIYATGDTGKTSGLRAANTLVRLIVVISLFHLIGASLRTYGTSILIVECLGMAAIYVLAQRSGVVGPVIPRPDLGDGKVRRTLFSYGGLAVLAQSAGLLYVTTDNLLIGRIYGAAAVTMYSLGARWLPMIRDSLSSLVLPLVPLFTQLEAKSDDERTRLAVRNAVAVTSALAVPCCLVPCVLGDLFLTNWIGPEYRAAYPILLVSLAPLTIDVSLSPVWAVLTGRGRIGLVAVGDMIVAIGNVVISLVLALPLGLGVLGFALGNTCALLARNLLLRPLVGRRESSVPGMWSLYGLVLRALAGGAPGLILLYFLRPLYGGTLVSVVAAGIIGAGVCFAGSASAAVGRRSLSRLFLSIRSRASST